MVRPFEARDTGAWALFRSRLWPDADPQDLARECERFARGHVLPNVATIFIAEDEASVAVGFLELSIRAFSDGCESMPVPHLEAWYVEPGARGRGFGAVLVAAAETWARSRGFSELASDTDVKNVESRRAHARCGFAEVEHLIKFRKSLHESYAPSPADSK